MTAIDLSAPMVRVMKEKLAIGNLEAQVEQGDMRNLHLPEDTYRAAYSWGDTVHHLTEPGDLEAFLASAYRVIEPGGYLLFNWQSPAYFEELVANGTFYEQHGEDFLLWDGQEEGGAYCLLTLNAFIKRKNGSYKRIEECHRLRIWEEETMIQAIRASGFTLDEVAAEEYFNEAARETRFQNIFVLKKGNS